MEGHGDDTDFAGNAFRTPGKITRIQAEGAVFGVAAASADKMDTFVANTGIGWLTAFLESSVSTVRPSHSRWWATRTSSCGSMLASHR